MEMTPHPSSTFSIGTYDRNYHRLGESQHIDTHLKHGNLVRLFPRSWYRGMAIGEYARILQVLQRADPTSSLLRTYLTSSQLSFDGVTAPSDRSQVYYPLDQRTPEA
jgi:hypothetical protein